MSERPDRLALPANGNGANPDPLLDAIGAARYLGLEGVLAHPEQAVRSLARKRRLRSCRLGSRLMFRRSWLEAYIEANAREAAV